MSKSLHHSFDIDLAEKYGVHEAIIIHHFQHWIRINQKLKRNLNLGRTWTYQTLDEIAAHFPYLSKSEVFEIIEKLCNGRGRRSKKSELFDPVLMKGNFNKKKYDTTTWYAFVSEEMFTVLAQAKTGIGSSQNGYWLEPTAIPDSIPNAKSYLPPLPPPSESPEDRPTFEEEEEICRRLKRRPKSAPPIVSMKKWRMEVIKDIRADAVKIDESDMLYKKHERQAKELDGQRLGDWMAFCCNGWIEFTSGSQCNRIEFEISDVSWQYQIEPYLKCRK